MLKIQKSKLICACACLLTACTSLFGQDENALIAFQAFTWEGTQHDRSRMSGVTTGMDMYIGYGRTRNASTDVVSPAFLYRKYVQEDDALSIADEGTVWIDRDDDNTDSFNSHMAATQFGSRPFMYWLRSNSSSRPFELGCAEIIPGSAEDAPSVGDMFKLPSSFFADNNINGVRDVAISRYGGDALLFIASRRDRKVFIVRTNGTEAGTSVLDNAIDFADDGWILRYVDTSTVLLKSGEEAVLVSTRRYRSASGSRPLQNEIKLWLIANDEIVWEKNVSVPNSPLYGSLDGQTVSTSVGYGPMPPIFSESPTFSYDDFSGNLATLMLHVNSASGSLFPIVYSSYYVVPLPESVTAAQSESRAQTLSLTVMGEIFTYQGSQVSNDDFGQNIDLFTMDTPVSSQSSDYRDVRRSQWLFFKGPNGSNGGSHTTVRRFRSLYLSRANPGQDLVYDDSSVTTPPEDPRVSSEDSLEEATAAYEQFVVSEWTLLGIIPGLPPMPEELANADTYISISYNQTGGSIVSQSSTQGYGVGFGVEAERDSSRGAGASFGFQASSSFDNAMSSGTSDGVELSYSVTLNLGNRADIGWMIVSRPIYATAVYEVMYYQNSTDAGSQKSMGVPYLFARWPVGPGTPSAIPFDITNPNQRPDIARLEPEAVFSFPVDEATGESISWPKTADYAAWRRGHSDEYPVLYPVASLMNNSFPFGVNIESDVTTETEHALTGTQTIAYGSSRTDTHNISTGFRFLWFNFGSSSSYTTVNSFETGFSASQGITITYPSLSKGNLSEIRLRAQLYGLPDTTDETPNWIPTVFLGSDPWILQWEVDQFAEKESYTGNNSFWGLYHNDPELNSDGWFYFFELEQWVFHSGEDNWYYFSGLGSWVYVLTTSVTDSCFFYVVRTNNWYYTDINTFFPVVYSFNDDSWLSL